LQIRTGIFRLRTIAARLRELDDPARIRIVKNYVFSAAAMRGLESIPRSFCSDTGRGFRPRNEFGMTGDRSPMFPRLARNCSSAASNEALEDVGWVASLLILRHVLCSARFGKLMD